MSCYSTGQLGDIAYVIMGQSPVGADTNREGNGLPLLNGPSEFGTATPTPVQWTTKGLRIAELDDVLFCVRGSTTGRMNVADQKYAIGRGLGAIRGKDSRDSKFVFHALQSSLPDLLAGVTGSVFPNLSRNQIEQHGILLPPAEERWAIAEVLGALDDNIAANTKLAQTADEFIRSSYLSVTEDCTKTISIADIAMYVRETVDPKQVEPDVIYVGLEHIPRRLMWLTEEGVAQSVTSAKAKFNAGDILFGKLRPYFHKVVAAPRIGICSTDVLPVRPARTELNGFVLAALSSDEIVREATAGSEGTRMPRANWKDLAAIQVPWPGEAVAMAFSEQVGAIRNSVEGLLDENRTLAATRDALLPQLMSGKVRVKDVADVVGSLV